MPLVSAPGYHPFTEGMVGVHFKMKDGTTLVHCMVSEEALRDRAAKDGHRQDNIDALFERYRAEIERLASDIYDSGVERPVVKSADLAS
jgi:heat shock protein HspQ